jgi:hypothetical protein
MCKLFENLRIYLRAARTYTDTDFFFTIVDFYFKVTVAREYTSFL